MSDKKEIIPKLQNATITVPAPEVDSEGTSHWYLSTSVESTTISVTLKADEGYTFESDGSLDYQGSYNSQTEPIPASHTDSVTFKLPDLDWYDQYIPLVVTMSAVKATPTEPTEPDTSTEPEPNSKPITPTLQNCSITEPAKSSDGKYYLDPNHMTVTLKADTGYTFEADGTLTYLSEYSTDIPITIKATKTDTATVSLPSDISWADQFNFPLTMSAVKTTTTPTEPDTPSTTPTTQLDVLKNSLRIPLDLKDDDSLLQSYIDAATEYLKSTLDEENTGTKLDSKRARVVINALAELMYQNRGDETVTKDFPFTLRALINQLKY
jgi:uncharacterized phage protein (predicted DNA packaging)